MFCPGISLLTDYFVLEYQEIASSLRARERDALLDEKETTMTDKKMAKEKVRFFLAPPESLVTPSTNHIDVVLNYFYWLHILY
jgi:hypothetical protein